MILIGLTGSIGMGKSETARMLRRLGVPVYDADAAVHALYARGGAAVAPIAAAFPAAVRNGMVDRAVLSRLVVGREPEIRRLERIVHPLVRQSQRRFLRRAMAARRPAVALDIPLLFETGGERRVDLVIVVSAPAFLQRQRVLRRPGMTPEKLAGILSRQMPDAAKRRRADVVLPSGLGRRFALDRLRGALDRARQASPKRRRVL